MFFLFQIPDTPPVVSLTLPHAVVAHAPFVAKLSITFATGLHGYQNPPSDPYTIPVKIKLASGDVKVIKVVYPAGTDLSMAGDPKPAKVYSGSVVVPIKLVAGTHTGDLVFEVDYQQCTESNCFAPSSIKAKATLRVSPKK
jgi:hypothetical protein